MNVKGHRIVRQGWPHDSSGNPYLFKQEVGCAKCSCGWVSLMAMSDHSRLQVYEVHIQQEAGVPA